MFERLRSKFSSGSYDAITSNGRRRAPKSRVLHEDDILQDRNRVKLQATTQDIRRNFSIAAWAIRKHLDWITSFTFQAKTVNADFNNELEEFMRRWGNRGSCDVRRKHSFRRMIRLAEACRVVDGDLFFLKVSGEGNNRGKLQAIESDRVATPTAGVPRNFKSANWLNGVKASPAGVPQEYAINRRTSSGGQEFERIVPASSMFVHAATDRFDQMRGISPIASALTTFQDTYEGIDYAKAKLKVHQLFAMSVFRDAELPFDGTSATDDKDDDGIPDSDYEVDWGKGPITLDLSPGDRAEFLESKTPATETVAFLQMLIHVSLKALDLPYSFFDEAHTNFFGSKGAVNNYKKSCETKQEDLRDLLNDITRWRVGMAVFDGDVQLPRGMEFDDIKWYWQEPGIPWWDASKEVRGHTMAIAAGLDSPQRVCKESGTDFYENVDAIAEAIEYARDKGITLQLATTGTSSIDEVQNQSEDADNG